MSAQTTARTFPPAPASVPEARGFVRKALADWGVTDGENALVVISELVTNVVVHAGTAAVVELRFEPGLLRLEVEDLHPTKMLEFGLRPASVDDEHGRGLAMTSSLSVAWGVEYRATTKRVWAEFALSTGGVGGRGPAELADILPTSSTGPAPRAAEAGPPPQASAEPDPLGLRSAALNRLAIDDLLRLVVERARERAQADAAYLLLTQGFGDEYVVQATSGLPVDLSERVVRPGETGAPGRWSQLAPVIVEDLDRTPAPLLDGLPLRGLVVAQVVFEGRVVGAIALASERPGAFTEHDGATLQLVADWVAGAVERARLQATERERRGWLGFLSDTGELLSGSLEPEMTVAMIGQIAVPRLATWCGIYLEDARGNTRVQHAWHADERSLDPLRTALQRTTPESVARDNDPALAGDVAVLPLGARGRAVGWLVLGRETGGPLRGELRTVAEAFATRAALAIDNARVHTELRSISQTLQRSLLPGSMPTIPGVDVGVGYEPAGVTTVGGDFYDVFPLGAGTWCFVVGDVCGKGAEAAAVTGIARHTIRAMMRSGFSLGTTLDRLNDAILEEGDRGRLLTLVCGTIESGHREWYDVRLVCAGHPPPFHQTAAGVGRLGRPQRLLGVFDRVSYEEEHLRLSRGSRLVMVTDGVLERRDDGRMFDDAGVEAELLRSGTFSAQGVADRLVRAVADFSDMPCADDLAVLVLDVGAAGRG
jgi:serine phosphatase RsbU (regulator of sigma subunit)/anti-sigma regulatory factor (Ser/Thr protein kinase)